MTKALKTQKIEIRVSETTKNEFLKAAAKAGEELSEFMIASGKNRASQIASEVPPLRDAQSPIHGFRYLIREGRKIKFKESRIAAIPAIIGMIAREEDPEEIADALNLPLAAILEAIYFCERFPEEVDVANKEKH